MGFLWMSKETWTGIGLVATGVAGVVGIALSAPVTATVGLGACALGTIVVMVEKGQAAIKQ